MVLALNEHELAEQLIFEKRFNNNFLEDIQIVARYYFDQGLNGSALYDKVKLFILSCDHNIAITSVRWDEIITKSISRAKKRPAVLIDSIDISDNELRDVESLNGTQLQRLYFTLLCLAKYWNVAKPSNNNWVTNKDSEIMKLANISSSIKRQGILYKALEDSGLVYFPKKIDSTSMRIDGVKDGDPVIKISILKNLGYQLLAYQGAPYFECQNCGVTTKISNPESGRKPKYCKNCAARIHTKQKISSVIYRRNIEKN